jgi:hypothetical protein
VNHKCPPTIHSDRFEPKFVQLQRPSSLIQVQCKRMDFEEILSKVGEFGSYQRRLFLVILLPYSLLSAWFHILPYFMISVPDHWCHVPRLQHLPNDVQFKLIRPLELNSAGQLKPSRCQMFDLDYERLLPATSASLNASEAVALLSSRATNKTRSCFDGWQYDRSEFDETLVTHVKALFFPSLITTRNLK